MTFEAAPTHQQTSDHVSSGEEGDTRRTRLIGVIALVIALVAVLSWLTRSSHSSQATLDDDISRIELSVFTGNIDIIGTDGGAMRIQTRTDDGWIRSARVTNHVEGNTLRIDGDCRGHRLIPAFGCRTDVTLTVPVGVDVVAASASGTVQARGLVGVAHLSSDAGDVVVTGHTGRLRAHSAAGDVVVTGLRADEAYVTSSAGTVRVEALTPPRSLDAESSAGPVSVELPAGVAYDIEAKSRTHVADVATPTSHASPHKVRAFSSTGPVDVTN
jgi:hypothetical protein